MREASEGQYALENLLFTNRISDIRNEDWDYLLRCDIVQLSPLYLNDMDLASRRAFF